jgi:hypothetical protein
MIMLNSHRTQRLAGWLALSVSMFVLVSCSSSNSSQGLGTLPKAMGAADEASAIQTLRTIATAEGQLKATRGSYGDFEALSRTPNLQGYLYKVSATDAEFTVNADPQATETHPATGTRHFYLDGSDNVVHANPTQSASKTDPVAGS